MPGPDPDSANERPLSRRQRWAAYIIDGLLGLGLALLALVAVTFT